MKPLPKPLPKPLVLFFTLAVALACRGDTVEPRLELPASTSTADSLVVVFGGTVLPMDDDRALDAHSVLVRDGRIAAIGPAEAVGAPPGSRVVDARGAWVIPGLIDMHVHINSDDVDDYVPHGVTTVRNMWGFVQLPGIIDAVESGDVRGPEIHSLSSGFDESPPYWPQTQLVDDLDRIVPLMDDQIAMGYREIKVYSDLGRAAYDSIAAYARANGLTIAGHVPNRVGLEHALATGQRSLEHLTGYDADRIADQAAATAAAGAWVCPTLAVLARRPGQATRYAMVRALHEASARILAGTDSGIGITAPGSSLADELERLVAAGLSPYAALRAATTDAAEYLGLAGEAGVLASGARADLVVLEGDPRREIGAVRRIRGVMLRGAYRIP